jgi:hypothetical protein
MQDELTSLRTEVLGAVADLQVHQTQATPPAHPEKWTIQQVVEHLMLTYRSSVSAIQGRIDKGRVTRARPSLQQRLGQISFLSLGHCPYGRIAPTATSPTLPTSIRSGADLGQRLIVELDLLDETLRRGEILFGTRRAVSHVMLGPLSMQQWRRFHLVHGRHHIRQILTIRSSRNL